MSSIIRTTPDNHAVDVVKNVLLQVQFDKDIDPASVNEYTLILAEDNTENLVAGSPGYTFGTRTAKFRLFEYLKSNTDYTFIIVGGDTGIKTEAGRNALTDNVVIRFQTGENIDPNIALAKTSYYDGPSRPFKGERGIYTEVFDKTGEPISHIVTTDGSVGPSGNIIPGDPDVYIPPDSAEEELEIISTSPENNAIGIESGDISVVFNQDIDPSNIVPSGLVDIEAEHFAGTVESSVPEFEISEDESSTLGIEITNLEDSTNYAVTLKAGIGNDSQTLQSDNVFQFQTKIQPFYTTVQTIRSQLGNLIVDVSDADIILSIYTHSKEIYDDPDITIEDPVQNEAVRYVICAVKLDLVQRRLFEGGPVTRKRLADLEIDRGASFSRMIGSLIEDLEDCVNKNMNLLQGKSATAIRSAIRGKNDPRRPIESTSWTRLTDNDF